MNMNDDYYNGDKPSNQVTEQYEQTFKVIDLINTLENDASGLLDLTMQIRKQINRSMKLRSYEQYRKTSAQLSKAGYELQELFIDKDTEKIFKR